jgi:hypothetical protein
VVQGVGRADTVIAASHDPAAEPENSENIGLEAVWPYGMIGPDGPLHALGVRTYLNRTSKIENDWSSDPIQAAHLGLADEFKSSALALTRKYQTAPSGLAGFIGPEFYVEQIGVLADSLQAALAQEYDGVLRIAPAWPKDWDADGTVFIPHGGKVHVQMRQGRVVTVGFESGSARTMWLANPWPGERVEVVDARTGAVVLPANSAAVLEFSARASTIYLVRRIADAESPLPFEAVTATPATAPKSLGSRTLGIPK